MSDTPQPNITTTQIIIFLFVFTIFVILGLTIGDNNLKITYFLVVSLILFTLINLYLTINSYKNLRNVSGMQGQRGPAGEQGPSGDAGVCTFSKKCGIKNCDDKVYNYIEHHNYYGDDMTKKCLKNPSKENCGNDDDLLKRATDLQPLIKTQINKCETSKKDWNTLKKDIFPDIN
jgi:hypothetical protein